MFTTSVANLTRSDGCNSLVFAEIGRFLSFAAFLTRDLELALALFSRLVDPTSLFFVFAPLSRCVKVSSVALVVAADDVKDALTDSTSETTDIEGFEIICVRGPLCAGTCRSAIAEGESK